MADLDSNLSGDFSQTASSAAATMANDGMSPSGLLQTTDIEKWLSSAITEAEEFITKQPNFNKIEESIKTIMSEDSNSALDIPMVRNSGAVSTTRTNRLAKICEDLAALMTDTKPFWEFSSRNRKFEQHSAVFSDLATYWYQRRHIDQILADVIKWSVVAGTGYFHMFWNPEIQDIDAVSEDPRNVLPLRPTLMHTLEGCVGVAVKRRVPTAYILDRYGVAVAPDSQGSALQRAVDSISDIASPIWRNVENRKSRTTPKLQGIPSTTLYTCYLKDYSVNKSGKPRYMGKWYTDQENFTEPITGIPIQRPVKKPENQWSYLVQPGDRLYPHGRMILKAGGKLLYDGPSYYWHDAFPVIKLTPVSYPWSWFGKAAAHDILPLSKSLNGVLRVIDDHANQVAQPGSIHDKNNVARTQFKNFDSRQPGYKIYQNPMAGKGIQIVNPPPLDNSIPEHRDWIVNEMGELSGIKDLSRMMDLKQLPSNSTVEQINNTMTPGIRARSRVLEAFQEQVAQNFLSNAAEFYTLDYLVAILGPGGILPDNFDFDPGSFVPDYIHAKDMNSQGGISTEALMRGPLPRYDRAKEFFRHFTFNVAPGSMLNSAQMERTLIFFQLSRAGVIDPITLMEQLNIPNIGVEQLPDNVRTILDRIQWCQQHGLMMNDSAAGRKASGQEPPRIKVSESG